MPGGTGVRAAAPSLKSQQRLAKTMEQVQEPGALRLTDLPQAYPRVGFAPDPRDTDMKIRAEIRDSPGVAATMAIGPEDVSYIKSKRRQEEQLAFDIWKANLFDLTDPVTANWVRTQIDPNIFTLQEQYLDSSLDVAKRYTKINMMGVQSHDDLEFLWMIKTGQVHVPAGFLPTQLIQALPNTVDQTRQPADFTLGGRGLFNPMRWFSIDRQAPSQGWATTNPVNPWIPPNTSLMQNGSPLLRYFSGVRGMPDQPRGDTRTSSIFGSLPNNAWARWMVTNAGYPEGSPGAEAEAAAANAVPAVRPGGGTAMVLQ